MACLDQNIDSLSFEKIWTRCVSDASTSAPCDRDRGFDRSSSSDSEGHEARTADALVRASSGDASPKGAVRGQSSVVTMLAIVSLAAMLGLGLTTCFNIPSQIVMPLVGLLLLEFAVLGFKPSTLASGLSGFFLVPVYVLAIVVFLALQTPPF